VHDLTYVRETEPNKFELVTGDFTLDDGSLVGPVSSFAFMTEGDLAKVGVYKVPPAIANPPGKMRAYTSYGRDESGEVVELPTFIDLPKTPSPVLEPPAQPR
jgi:hypothetical protein